MIFVFMFALAFGASDIKETYTADVRLTTTNGAQYAFKRVYEDQIKIHNIYPDSFTEHDKKICESLSELDNIEYGLEDNENEYPEEN